MAGRNKERHNYAGVIPGPLRVNGGGTSGVIPGPLTVGGNASKGIIQKPLTVSLFFYTSCLICVARAS
jgi:hypothetical protein